VVVCQVEKQQSPKILISPLFLERTLSSPHVEMKRYKSFAEDWFYEQHQKKRTKKSEQRMMILADQQTKELVKNELLKLRQNYKPFKVRSDPGKFPLIFTIVFHPTHQMNVDFEGVQLRITIDEDYPIGSFPVIDSVESLKTQPLPAGLLRKLQTSLQNQCRVMYDRQTREIKVPILLDLLDWFDRNCASLVMDMQYVESYMAENADGSSCRRYAFKVGLVTEQSSSALSSISDIVSQGGQNNKKKASAETGKNIGNSSKTHDEFNDRNSNESDQEELSSDEEGDSDDDDDDDGGVDGSNVMISLMHAPLSLSIGSVSEEDVGLAFEYIDLQGISVIECSELSILVLCSRCQKQIPVRNLSATDTFHCECDACKKEISVTFHPVPIINNDTDEDADKSIIGKQWAQIELSGCAFFDTLPACEFRALCFECSTVNLVGTLRPRTHNSSTCRKCHKDLDIVFNGIKKQELADLAKRLSASTTKGKTSPRSNQKKKATTKVQGITEGRPLPNNGTCKHYKHSKRWLRFSCCGRAFPCDICHEEQTSDRSIFATRMLCGYCSREQPCGDTCKFCQKKLTKKVFDPSSRKKSAFKTASRKSERQAKK